MDSSEYQATCGVRTTLSSFSSASPGAGGSCGSTSSPAPPIRFDCSASVSAGRSTIPPRAVLMRNAVRFILPNASRPKSPFVSAVSGQCTEMKSERRSSASKSTSSTPSFFACSGLRYGS